MTNSPAELIMLTPANAGPVVEGVRVGRIQVTAVEVVRQPDAGESAVGFDDSSPAATAASLVALLADRRNLGVQLQVRRERKKMAGGKRVFDRAGRSHPYRSVAEDIEWLRDVWLTRSDYLTDAELRRGSTQLSLLLGDDLAGKAWRHYGFEKQPVIEGPNVVAIATRQGRRLEMAVSLIAGGGQVSDIELSFLGAFRVDNPKTGARAEDDVGFAMSVGSVVRDARQADPGEPDRLVRWPWFLSEYVDAVGAVRRGTIISRREVIAYFRNYMGGAHHDLATGRKHQHNPTHELLAELDQALGADVRDGLHFELLSIGQAVARSPDLRRLAQKIRDDIETSSAS